MKLACDSISLTQWQSYSSRQSRSVPRVTCQCPHASIANRFVESNAYRTLGWVSYTQLAANLFPCFAKLQDRSHRRLIFRALSSTPMASHCLTTSWKTQNKRKHLTTRCLAGKPVSSVDGSIYIPSTLNYLRSERDSASVFLVDVAGNKGHDISSLRTRFPDLPGRLVLQDLPQTFEDLPPLVDIEVMPHDMFTEQPIKG